MIPPDLEEETFLNFFTSNQFHARHTLGRQVTFSYKWLIFKGSNSNLVTWVDRGLDLIGSDFNMFTIVGIYFLDDIKVRLSNGSDLFRFPIKDIGLAFTDSLSFFGNGLAFPMIDNVVKQVIGCSETGLVISIGIISIQNDSDNAHATFIWVGHEGSTG